MLVVPIKGPPKVPGASVRPMVSLDSISAKHSPPSEFKTYLEPASVESCLA